MFQDTKPILILGAIHHQVDQFETVKRMWILLLFVVCFLTASFAAEMEPISPLPLENINPAEQPKIDLGQLLFHDARFSKDNSVSCANCHDLGSGGDDNRAKSIGLGGTIGDINAPTIFNSGFNFRQFWNGRAKKLEDQIDGPIENPKELGSSWSEILTKLKNDNSLNAQFSKVYKDGLNEKNIKDAIAVFERTLTTPNSRFDRYLRGEKNILSEQEKTGYQHFKSFGCVACHQGVNIGGNMYQTMGVMGNYFKDRGTPVTDADLGRYTITKNEQDKYVFRVPSLRNVDLTSPYFHDGTVATLSEAVNVMAKYQLGRKLSTKENSAIVSFLKTLTGQRLARYIQREVGNSK